jgi:hypothetical protein
MSAKSPATSEGCYIVVVVRRILVPAFFYTVALGINKSSPKKPWLVELLCTHHKKSPEVSACDVAESAVREKFGPEAIVGYRDANEYSQTLPMNLGRAHFIAPLVVVLGLCRFDTLLCRSAICRCR